MRLLPFFLIINIFLACGSGNGFNNQQDFESAQLTLLRSFGGDDVAIDYLLVEPDGIAVDGEGNIYVTDEERVKVFTNGGGEKAIIGSRGQGPGEFQYASCPTIGPQGLLTVANGINFNLFGRNYNYLKTIRHDAYKRAGSMSGSSMSDFPPKVVSITENEYVGDVKEFIEYLNDVKNVSRSLHYYKDGNSVELARYRQICGLSFTDDIKYGGEGLFIWKMLPGKKVVFTETVLDVTETDGNRYYAIHILSLETLEKVSITQRYKPIRIPESEWGFFSKRRETDESWRKIWEFVRSNPFYSALQDILVDGDTIYAFTNQSLTNEDYVVDVFDAARAEYLGSISVPRLEHYSSIPQVIKNGYAYRIRQDFITFPIIEVYRFEPGLFIETERLFR